MGVQRSGVFAGENPRPLHTHRAGGPVSYADGRWLRSRSEPAAVHGLAIVLAQATPDAIRFADGKGVLGALDADRATAANFLCGLLPGLAGRATLTLWVEEDVRVGATAGSEKLPIPNIRIGAGEPGDVCHDGPFVESPNVQNASKVGQVFLDEKCVNYLSPI